MNNDLELLNEMKRLDIKTVRKSELQRILTAINPYITKKNATKQQIHNEILYSIKGYQRSLKLTMNKELEQSTELINRL